MILALASRARAGLKWLYDINGLSESETVKQSRYIARKESVRD